MLPLSDIHDGLCKGAIICELEYCYKSLANQLTLFQPGDSVLNWSLGGSFICTPVQALKLHASVMRYTRWPFQRCNHLWFRGLLQKFCILFSEAKNGRPEESLVPQNFGKLVNPIPTSHWSIYVQALSYFCKHSLYPFWVLWTGLELGIWNLG